MLDNKESFNKVGISRNDEPTRFLTEEEMEQLEQARFNYETKVENTPKTTVEKNNKIKIEDIAPETKTKLTISQKTKNVVRKILIVASFVIVAILGFYLAFSWNMPIDRDDEEIVKTEVRQELKLDDKIDENNFDTQVSEKVETFEAKVDKAKQILGGLEKDIAQDKDLKENITDLKNSTQGFLDEHSDEISILRSHHQHAICLIFFCRDLSSHNCSCSENANTCGCCKCRPKKNHFSICFFLFFFF